MQKQSSDVWLFLYELYKRMALKSPKFFQVLQTIGMVVALITGIPLAIQQAEMFLGLKIALPEVVNHWMVRVVFACGLIVKIMAKLPVIDSSSYTQQTNNGAAAPKYEVLPFTSNVNETK